MAAGADRYQTRSLWLDDLPGDDLTPRPSLPGDTTVDVVIVGACFTGLWTAYELAGRDPSLRILVVEAEVAGFGASVPVLPFSARSGSGRDAVWALVQAWLDAPARTRHKASR